MKVRAAERDVVDLVESVRNRHHLPRLAEAGVAVEFKDGKPFVNDRLNLGKTTKFAPSHKLWQGDSQYDFLISLCEEAWGLLTQAQREALVDLRLTCCHVEYVPEMVEVNGKRKPAKDRWGRIVYTGEIMTDEDGEPKWKVRKDDLQVVQENVVRYGCWYEELSDLQAAIRQAAGRSEPAPVET